jgi:hypothetical protein
MRRRFAVGLAVVCGAAAIASGEPPQNDITSPNAEPEVKRFTLDEAKERAKVMHPIYAATLHTMHDHYFHANRAVLPARAMEEIFAAVSQETRSTARWISVNTKAMSVEHEPKTDFEKQAATEIAAGKPEHAAVDQGFYRSVRPIPLTGGCLSCHAGLGAPTKVPRFAGLVISIPVQMH